MKVPNFTDPQFVDADGVGGFNAAFGTVSGSLSSTASGAWALPGLLAPESMGVSLSGMVASVNLPLPWGLVSSGGVVVRAHGTQTGQDTTLYAVDFTSLVPGSGSVTAYLAATVQTIQQNPFAIPGPPPGHPSYNPNYVPTVGYATTVYTVALSAATGAPDNTGTFELLRTTLSAGQTGIAGYDTSGWQRAANRAAAPSLFVTSGGTLTPQQLHGVVSPTSGGFTLTLPNTSIAGGLTARFDNSTSGTLTIAVGGADLIDGMGAGGVASVTMPASGALSLWANAVLARWVVTGFNNASNNVWTGTNVFMDANGSTLSPTVSGQSSNGAAIRMIGGGVTTTPKKWLRVVNGELNVVNDAYTQTLLSVTDAGIVSSLNRLRASVGAFGSGDPHTATILNDFSATNGGTGSNLFTYRFPDGHMLQGIAVLATSSGSGGPETATFNLTTPFTSEFTSCICQFDGTSPPSTANIGSISSQPLNLAQFTVTTNFATPGNFGVVVWAWGK